MFLSSPYLTPFPQHCPAPVPNCVQAIGGEGGHQLRLNTNILGGVQILHMKTQCLQIDCVPHVCTLPY